MRAPSLPNNPPNGRAGLQAQAGSPIVLVIDDEGWEQFEQLASSLRRKGVRTTRLALGPGKADYRRRHTLAGRLRDRWVYSGRIGVSDLQAGGRAPGGLADATIADVLVSEFSIAALGLDDPFMAELGRRALAFRRYPPQVLLDKFKVNELLAAGGSLLIPGQVLGEDVTPEQAARRLGLPLMVKSRLGAGGAGVRLARSISDIRQALERLSDPLRRNVFYQQYIPGRMAMYGSVTGPGGPLLERGWVAKSSQWELGPVASVAIHDDPELLRAGRLAVETLGCWGLSEIGFVEDAEGRYWHVDANLRTWGSMMSLLTFGLDFAGAYATLIQGGALAGSAEPLSGVPSDTQPVLPFSLYLAASRGQLGTMGRLSGPFVRICREGPGLGYALLVARRLAILLLRSGLGVIAGRGRDAQSVLQPPWLSSPERDGAADASAAADPS